jgi:hypothetical protein
LKIFSAGFAVFAENDDSPGIKAAPASEEFLRNPLRSRRKEIVLVGWLLLTTIYLKLHQIISFEKNSYSHPVSLFNFHPWPDCTNSQTPFRRHPDSGINP